MPVLWGRYEDYYPILQWGKQGTENWGDPALTDSSTMRWTQTDWLQSQWPSSRLTLEGSCHPQPLPQPWFQRTAQGPRGRPCSQRLSSLGLVSSSVKRGVSEVSLFALVKLRENKVLSGYIYFSFKMKMINQIQMFHLWFISFKN